MNFHIDFEGTYDQPHVQKALLEMSKSSIGYTPVGSVEVPWFPTRMTDFNFIGKRILGEGHGIQEVDHPGFRDESYKSRRKEITTKALDYQVYDPISRIDYIDTEIATWKFCFDKLTTMFPTYACKEFNQCIDSFRKNVKGFSSDSIPQLEDISQFLIAETGWRLKPVGGLLTQREFLNGLAFRVFHSTQYIRHESAPLYTPEPDVVHELLGHAPMFAHKEFAEFSQEIGLASLGASELEIRRLASIYWFTLEFGMCKDGVDGKPRAYGAGICSSVGELAYACSDEPKLFPLDPQEIAQNHLDFPISSMQPHYFLAESFEKAKIQIKDYCQNMNKPFQVTYNASNDTIEVDRFLNTRSEIA